MRMAGLLQRCRDSFSSFLKELDEEEEVITPGTWVRVIDNSPFATTGEVGQVTGRRNGLFKDLLLIKPLELDSKEHYWYKGHLEILDYEEGENNVTRRWTPDC